jgi:nucleotide-binding universal stress UspA family protein
MRSIVLPADRTPAFAARLETALGLARAHRGHLTIQIDTPVTQYIVSDMFTGAMIAVDALQQAHDADVVLGQRLDAKLASEDVPFDIQERTDDPVDVICDVALLADLVVCDLGFARLGELLVRTPTPVLALPAASRPAMLQGVAVVAWDGSKAASRALRAATPLLQGFATVHVVTVTPRNRLEMPSTDVLRYLSRHDVHAEYRELPFEHSVEETLAAETRRLGAELVVMGAYGHSRLREFLTGGVTRYFLTAGEPALFLAH